MSSMLRHSRKIGRTSPPPGRRLDITLFAVGSIALGTIGAIYSVPSEIGRTDALFWPAVYLTVALIIPVVVRVRSHFSSLLRVENVLMLGIIYWLMLDLLQSAYSFDDVSVESVELAFASCGAFAIAIWVGASGRGWRLPRTIASVATRPFSVRTLWIALLVAFILGMSKFVIGSGFDPLAMLQGLTVGRWDAPWGRGALGGADAIVDHMQYFGYIIPSLCVLIATRVGWSDRRVLAGLIMSGIVMAFLSQSGNRRVIGVVVGAAIFTWITSRGRLNSKLIIGGGVAVALLLFFLQEMLRYRGDGFGVLWTGDPQPQLHVSHLHVDDNFLRLAQLISFYPGVMDYVLHQPVFHALVLPIPRVLWPGKPDGPGFDLTTLLDMHGLSLSYSIVGELYVSFGVWAVLAGGWIIGRLAGMWNKILLLPTGDSRPLMFGLGVMTLFAGLRSMQAMVQMSYIVLAWIAVAAIIARRT